MTKKAEIVVEAARSQIGCPYCFGAWGEECTPGNRRKRARDDHPTIVSKCQVLNGSRSTCEGCRWRGCRMFDCRGFTHWSLEQAGISIEGGGATSQYNNDANWIVKGPIGEMPRDIVCCVFVRKDNKMSHTGLYCGDGKTVECSNGVEEHSLASKWTHYAVPKGLDQEIRPPEKLSGECVVDVPNDGTLNVRKEPRGNAKIMRTFREGDKVDVVEDDGTWSRIRIDAYVMSKFLRKGGE